jgi:predicted nucleic acid-binding protein
VTTEAVDTSVVVAALLGWHEAHEPARRALERGLAAERIVMPAPALLEAYAVMTRLPSPHRIRPADAAALLGTGGDGSNGGTGTFFEGAITRGAPPDSTDDAVQADIVAAGYGK